MIIPTNANIDAASRIRHSLSTWDAVDTLLYSEFKHLSSNDNLRDVTYKVTLLDKLYNCNLKANYADIAKHIVSCNIDPDLLEGKTVVVEKITLSPLKKILVFASKYCHFHQPSKFPMWDRYAAEALHRLLGGNYPKEKNYSKYKADIDGLIQRINPDLSYKILDQYLWLYGQKVLKYKNASIEVKQMSSAMPNLFSQLDPPQTLVG